jgi:hypothetical protein
VISPTEPLAWYVEDGREPNDGDNASLLREEVELNQRFTAKPDIALTALGCTPGAFEPVFLPETARGCAVALAAHWDTASFKMRIALFRFDEDLGLVARGLRFDSPDASPGHDHHMYHAQPIYKLTKPSSDIRLPGPVALPDDEPGVPLPAQDSTGLVTCLLLSLYGRKLLLEASATKGDRLATPLKKVLGAALHRTA